MTIVAAKNGKLQALKYLIGELTATEELRIRLYKNDYTPLETSVTGDFTEAAFTGYASVLLSDWTITEDLAPYATHSQVLFNCTQTGSAETIYGYYIVRASTNDLVAAKRLEGAPYNVEFIGDVIAVTPTVKVS